MALIFLQYFFSLLKSSSMVFTPTSLFQRSDAFVNAFFLERYLQVTCKGGGENGKERGCPKLISKVRGVSELFASKYLKSVDCKNMSIKEEGRRGTRKQTRKEERKRNGQRRVREE